jgi:hypothetical protein
MATLTVADASAVLKQVYLPMIIEALNNSTILTKHVRKGGTEDFVGTEIHFPVHSGRNGGVGVRPENVGIPTAGKQAHLRAVHKLSYQYATICLSGPAISGSKGNAAAFSSLLDIEMKGAIKDTAQNYNRQLWGDGTGLLTDTGLTSAATTVLCDSTKFIFDGMEVDLLVNSSGALASAGSSTLLVSNVVADTSFDVPINVTTSATLDGVYGAGAFSSAQIGREVFGLKAHVRNTSDARLASTAGFPGQLAKTGQPAWQGHQANATGTMVFSDWETMWDTIDINSGETPNIAIGSHATRRAYARLFDSERRHVNTMRLKGGWTGLEFNNIGVFADKDAHEPSGAAYDDVFFLNLNSFRDYVQEEWDWIPGENGVLSKARDTNGKIIDAWEGALHSYRQFVCKAPNRNGVLSLVD